MAWSGRADRIRQRGRWPGRIELMSGWARAVVRPWNDDVHAASLRLERGGSRFLAACARLALGWAPEILSPATLPAAGRVWTEAGFVAADRLLLMEHGLAGLTRPDRALEDGGLEPLDEIHLVDTASFLPRWRLGRIGLAESFTATTRAVVTRIRAEDGRCVAFAISGVGLGVGYLQRLAVDPGHRGAGLGSDLVRASLLWARRQGAATMLVNTQVDNVGAAALYERLGFREVAGGLLLFRFDPAAAGSGGGSEPG